MTGAKQEFHSRSITVQETVCRLRTLAIAALEQMYLSQEGLFAFRVRHAGGRSIVEGTSRRYTAIVLLGLANSQAAVISSILAGKTVQEVCGHLLDQVNKMSDLGEVALTLWAARAVGHQNLSKAMDRLRSMDPAGGPYPTVELAWSLAAMASGGLEVEDSNLAKRIAARLLSCFNRDSAMFPHWPDKSAGGRFRRHVSCFADLVYPIQALCYYGQATGSGEALDVAGRCAARMCELQGPQGQWWWHYDLRTGQVIERYPVYAVHQDAMAPMALFAVKEACGVDYRGPIQRGLAWLTAPPETERLLIDSDAGLIWRKVARSEPAKLSRGVQALASYIHPAMRIGGLDRIFKPGKIDYECRPYHLGWLLYAWPAGTDMAASGTA